MIVLKLKKMQQYYATILSNFPNICKINLLIKYSNKKDYLKIIILIKKIKNKKGTTLLCNKIAHIVSQRSSTQRQFNQAHKPRAQA